MSCVCRPGESVRWIHPENDLKRTRYWMEHLSRWPHFWEDIMPKLRTHFYEFHFIDNHFVNSLRNSASHHYTIYYGGKETKNFRIEPSFSWEIMIPKILQKDKEVNSNFTKIFEKIWKYFNFRGWSSVSGVPFFDVLFFRTERIDVLKLIGQKQKTSEPRPRGFDFFQIFLWNFSRKSRIFLNFGNFILSTDEEISQGDIICYILLHFWYFSVLCTSQTSSKMGRDSL